MDAGGRREGAAAAAFSCLPLSLLLLRRLFPLPWVAEAKLLPRITMAATGTEGGEALQAHWSGEEGGRRAERLEGPSWS